MKAINSVALFLLLACVYIAWLCTKVKEPNDLNEYILDKKNGLHKEQVIGPVKVSVTYRPTDLMINQSQSNQPSKIEVDSLRVHYNHYEYFILTFSADNKEIETYSMHKNTFRKLVETLAFEMNEHVKIITDNKDTLYIADYIYQRTYGAGKESNLLVAFDAERLRQSNHFIFEISEFGLGLGNQIFNFETNRLKETPRINLEPVNR